MKILCDSAMSHRLLPFLALVSLTLSSSVPTRKASRQAAPWQGFNWTQPDDSEAVGSCDYWLADIQHQGIAPYQNDSSYQIFRNVRDFGAVGNGVADDTAAINAAISAPGNRCAPGLCNSSTTSPAVIYFPPGDYLISSSIIQYYYTSLIGNPNCLPTIKASANFSGVALIDSDPYVNGTLAYGATNVFWRQNRNFILDMTNTPASSETLGIHWPTGQATSLTNIVFQMSSANETQHRGIFIESGSGGLLSDLIFNGGLAGANFSNQQFTSRNFTFNGCKTAINLLFDWSWTFQQTTFNNVSLGINMTNAGTDNQAVGGIVIFDSAFNNVDVGVLHANNGSSYPPAAGNIILENVDFVNTNIAIQGPDVISLQGGTYNVPAWGLGHAYTSTSSNFTFLNNSIPPFQRPAALVDPNQQYYTRTKPQYADLPASSFLSVRSLGARGDGVTDDTSALQTAILQASEQNKIVFIDGGYYVITSTIYVPSNTKIVGEPYPVLLATGPAFSDINAPVAVIQVGHPGEVGAVEWSDTILSTRGPAPGAVLIEWNLASAGPLPASPLGPSGLWDVHTRIGGFTGSDLQINDCPSLATKNEPLTSAADINQSCIAAFASLHITPSARNVYLENTWLWVADHDADDGQLRQITVYAGRGALIEANYGIWMVGTAIEHHTLYEYAFVNTQDIFAGHVQTETAYYQPNPPASLPFPAVQGWNDPVFPEYCLNGSSYLDPNSTITPDSVHNDCDGWAYRIVDSSSVLTYGAGFYSFFDNYNVTCSNQGLGSECQSRIIDIQNSEVNVGIYGLNTVGVQNMVTVNGRDLVPWEDNVAGFTDGITLFTVT